MMKVEEWAGEWLDPATSWGVGELEAGGDPFECHGPPFDLLSDMLFAFALAPAGPMARAFPGVPFLALRGRVPLAMWFSCIRGIGYTDGAGARGWDGGAAAVLYHELNIVAALRARAIFVPDIRATSERIIRLGWRYGMPKQPTVMRVAVVERHVESDVVAGDGQSMVRARRLTPGYGLGALVGRLWPRRLPPARFPDGRDVRALIQATPRVQLARVQGQLALDAPWLPDAVPLLPLGLYVPDQRMQLPPPGREDQT